MICCRRRNLMTNIPEIRLGIVAVSRDCFPIELSQNRRRAVVEACNNKNISITELQTTVENENDALKALDEIKKNDINALVVHLGNFGPEGPTTILAQKFDGPAMFVAAAEDSGDSLLDGRGDAYCGLLNSSYNIGLRNLKVYIPEYPVGIPTEIADMISDFLPIARIINGLKKLKIFSFGPRPQDFLACNAPIKPLYELGVEIMENSELDLYDIYLAAEGHPQIPAVAEDMAKELGSGNQYPDFLKRLARYEIALLNFMKDNLGASEYGIFANKCWPAFMHYFKFVPCFVNSRLAARVEGRSSYARLGLVVHMTAPTIHAGFSGHIVLEMMNFGPFPLKIDPGRTLLCQLIFEELGDDPDTTLNTHFQGQDSVTGQTGPR